EARERDAAAAQAVEAGGVEDVERVDAVAAGAAEGAHLLERDLLAEVVQHHGQRRRATLHGGQLLDERDLAASTGQQPQRGESVEKPRFELFRITHLYP